MRRCGLLLLAGAVALPLGCGREKQRPSSTETKATAGVRGDGGEALARASLTPLGPGEVYVYDGKPTQAVRTSEADARSARSLIVNLGDDWAPFIFQDGGSGTDDPPKPNGYRATFVGLANDRLDSDGRALEQGAHNFLEPFGIPPTLSVLRSRIEAGLTPAGQACEAQVDVEGLRAFSGNVVYQDRERARREHAEAVGDDAWLTEEIARREAAAPTGKAGDRSAAVAALRADPDPKVGARVDRSVRGQERVRAVGAAQARLSCQGLLSARSRFTPGMFDLPTHEALAAWERKNDIFGWASLGGETLAALSRPPLELDFEAFRRVLAERVADAAGIIEDGSTAHGPHAATYRIAAPDGGAGTAARDGAASNDTRAVPDLIDEHVNALLANLRVTAGDLRDFLAQHGPAGLATLRIAMPPPPLPPYYAPRMDLSVEIDRGDVWYDFPFDARGRAVEQRREHYPSAALFVTWHGQKIPLVRWRTTIGSWRSELHANGKVYYKYKNSDVGPRFWRNIVAGPVWVPPDATPAKDLLTRKVLNRERGSELVVNTAVMGPGFQSAYGLVMAIHVDRNGFDNQIRTHGSVDYTSIARRFSHGCHRLVNNRAVRLFDFVLRHQAFRRMGTVPLALQRQLVVDDQSYPFEIKTRGYYYGLIKPVPIEVTEGRVMGKVKEPVTAYVPKSGVDYSDVPDPSTADSATTTTTPAAMPPATTAAPATILAPSDDP